MPLDKDAMREYQRKRRAKTGDNLPAVIPTKQLDFGGEHYWLRKLGDDFVTCTAFEMQGRMIGGCGEVRDYEGTLLSTRMDGGKDFGAFLTDYPASREIYLKMPLSPKKSTWTER